MPLCDYGVIDSFDRSDQVLNTDPRWVTIGENVQGAVISNQMGADTAGGDWNYYGSAFASAKYGGDVQMAMTVKAGGNEDGYAVKLGMMVKMSNLTTGTGNGYALNATGQGGGSPGNPLRWQWYRKDAGTYTALGSYYDYQPAANDDLFISAKDDASGTLTWYLNGTQQLQTTDSTYKSQLGYIWIRGLKEPSTGTGQPHRYDDLKMGATITEFQRWRTAADDASIGTELWTNPNNAKTSDDTRASVVLALDETSDYIKLTSHGSAAYPAGTTCQGIITYAECNASLASRANWTSVRIVVGGTITGTEHSDATTFGTTDADVPTAGHGGATDNYDLSLTAAQMNADDFGLVMAVYAALAVTANLDNPRMRLYTTLPSVKITMQPKNTLRPRPFAPGIAR